MPCLTVVSPAAVRVQERQWTVLLAKAHSLLPLPLPLPLLVSLLVVALTPVQVQVQALAVRVGMWGPLQGAHYPCSAPPLSALLPLRILQAERQ